MIGFPQFIASAERLTATRSVPDATNSEATIQTPCALSKTTEGSLAARYVPPAETVRPGRKPFVQLVPPFVEVAKPMSEAPPLNLRPTWKAVTIVEPDANMPGSTSVACWLSELVKMSALNRVSENCGGGGGWVGCEGVLWPPPHPVIQSRANTASAVGKHVFEMPLLRAAIIFANLTHEIVITRAPAVGARNLLFDVTLALSSILYRVVLPVNAL